MESKTRYLGLDIGDRRIGVALSDPTGMLASPLTIIDRRDDRQDIEAIIGLIDRYQVKGVIVGLPLSMEGVAGKQAEKVQAFVQEMSRHTEIPVEFRDERLTTVSARRLIQAARTKKTKQKVKDDAIAAALILQGYLDETKSSEAS